MVTGSEFKFIAGTLCLDFVNTVGGHGPSGVILRDKLAGYGDLVQWSEAAGLLTHMQALEFAGRAARNPVAARALFDRAIALREALYRICKSCLEQRTPSGQDVAALNSELVVAQTHQRLEFSGRAFVRSWDQPRSLDRILWSVVTSAADFLESPDLQLLRQCPGDDCGWLFMDTSRNGSRQWCEMRICGNRAKLRRFRQRLHGL